MRKTKMTALLLAMCFCISACGTATDTSEKQQALKQEGMELQAAGDYSGAIAKYEEALKLSNMEYFLVVKIFHYNLYKQPYNQRLLILMSLEIFYKLILNYKYYRQ